MKVGIDLIGITTPFYCFDEKGRILMHKRSINCRDEHGKWDPGSGKLEFDLSLEENVLKELEEEYGCKGEIIEKLPAHDILLMKNNIKTHWLVIPFVIKINPYEAKIGEPNKMDDIGWFSINDLPEPLHSGFLFTLENYKDYFNKYFK